MEAMSNAYHAAQKAWGNQPQQPSQPSHEEPISGIQGKGTPADPYDAGNVTGSEPISGVKGQGTASDPYDAGNASLPDPVDTAQTNMPRTQGGPTSHHTDLSHGGAVTGGARPAASNLDPTSGNQIAGTSTAGQSNLSSGSAMGGASSSEFRQEAQLHNAKLQGSGGQLPGHSNLSSGSALGGLDSSQIRQADRHSGLDPTSGSHITGTSTAGHSSTTGHSNLSSGPTMGGADPSQFRQQEDPHNAGLQGSGGQLPGTSTTSHSNLLPVGGADSSKFQHADPYNTNPNAPSSGLQGSNSQLSGMSTAGQSNLSSGNSSQFQQQGDSYNSTPNAPSSGIQGSGQPRPTASSLTDDYHKQAAPQERLEGMESHDQSTSSKTGLDPTVGGTQPPSGLSTENQPTSSTQHRTADGAKKEESAPPRPGEENIVRSTGFAAEGGDFDATNPGAGKEADRLLEEQRKNDPNAAPLKSSSSNKEKPADHHGGLWTGTHKAGITLEKAKDKLHIGKSSNTEG